MTGGGAAFLDTLSLDPLPLAFNAGGFDCGEQELTDYLIDGTALRDQAASVSRTYLVKSGPDLVGYFSISADAIRLSNKERKDVGYSWAPALKLGRMGVATGFRGRSVGEWILKAVTGFARELSITAGIRYVTLDALPRPRLVAWYGRNNFVRNTGHESALKAIRHQLARIGLDVELPHVSMRLDILSEEELAALRGE